MTLRPVSPRVTQFLTSKASILRAPISGTFELTPVCNMNCKMCYVRMSREQQESIEPLHSAQEWIQLGRDAVEQGMLYLLLTGGEPFVHPQFREIMEGLQKLGLIISINSNGTLIDEETVEWMKQNPPSKINITLYGASDSTYEKLCGNPHGFTQATRAIRMLKEAGINVKLNCSLTPDNIDDLQEMLRIAEELQVVLQATTYMFPPLRKDSSSVGKNQRFSPEEAAYYQGLTHKLQFGEQEFDEGLRRLESLSAKTLENPTKSSTVSKKDRKMKCKAGLSAFWVTWQGNVGCCGMIPQSGNNVFNSDFSQAWQTVQDIRDSVLLPEECSNCAYQEECQPCAAMTFTETGHFDQVPRYKCQMMHEQVRQYRKLSNKRLGDKNETELERVD